MEDETEVGRKMSDFELHAFNSLIGRNIITNHPNHKLLLKWYKNVHGFIATCSCGERIGKNSMTGNNWAGWDYGLLAIKERFNNHVSQQSSETLRKCEEVTGKR